MSEDSFAAGLVGIILDQRYRLDALLGEGGMGAVYRATHLSMDRRVAVKLLKPHLSNDETQLQRFAREARSTLKVDSPHAVKVLDFGVTPHRDYYMVLEYLDGRTVQRELDIDGPFAPARVVQIARQALHALAAAHRIGIVHRDIKPDNLLLMRSGGDPDFTKVLDFGVAKLMEGAAVSDQSALALTQIGMVFGTPEFMSPEQACGHALDGRSDLYSLAATMFAMLTGCALFEAGSPIEWLTHHARTPPPSLGMAQPALAAYPELDRFLQRCLAKHRERRPSTAEEMELHLAELAPTLDRATGASPPERAAGRAPLVSPSSYLPALAQDQLDPGATLAPPEATPDAMSDAMPDATPPAATDLSTANLRARSQPRVAAPRSGQSLRGMAPSTSGVIRQLRGRGRGVVLAVGSIAIVAALGAAAGIALSRRTSPSTSITADAAIRSSTPAGPAADARPRVLADAPESDAGIDPGIDPGIDAETDPGPGAAATRPVIQRRSAAREHLRNAEKALRSNNRLRQLAEADLALRADPRNARAKFLLGDALVKTGDLARGCAYLRGLKRDRSAQSRANAAGCPTD